MPRSVTCYDRVKRFGDVLVSGGLLVVLSPVVLGTALLVRVKLGPNVLFRQERPGLNGRVFEMLKFRTMADPDPAHGLVTDEERMTPFGDRLRGTSLDELPGLLNVLRGDMSLVGPRPLRTRYLERYSREQAHRHDVLPGLTGLAQISGRNSLSWDDRLALDVHYVRSRGVATDLRILLATVPKVFRREGIAEDGQATMRDFFGPRRIGIHEIRPAADAGAACSWEVVDRGVGAVVARCEPECFGGGEMVVSLHIDPRSTEADVIRARATEMLLGIAREQGADIVRIAGPARDLVEDERGAGPGSHVPGEVAGDQPLAAGSALARSGR